MLRDYAPHPGVPNLRDQSIEEWLMRSCAKHSQPSTSVHIYTVRRPTTQMAIQSLLAGSPSIAPIIVPWKLSFADRLTRCDGADETSMDLVSKLLDVVAQ